MTRMKALTASLVVCLVAALALTACSVGGGAMFDKMSTRVTESHQSVVDLTDLASQYIPIGTSEQDADAMLRANGFTPGDPYTSDEFDDRKVRSQIYKAYRRGTSFPALTFSGYVVALGFTGSKVDFVSAEAKGEAI